MNNFYTPQEVRPYYPEIVPAYQTAFAGEPWFEVSKCADVDRPQRCAGGLSRIAVGQTCSTCTELPSRPAYESSELTDRFDSLAATRPTSWYLERPGDKTAMAALAWQASASVIAQEKYSDDATMEQQLIKQLGNGSVIWLDEVFANRSVRRTQNLRRFGAFCTGFMDRLSGDRLAYRTISPQMIAAAKRDFGEQAQELTTTDRRTLLVITRPGSTL